MLSKPSFASLQFAGAQRLIRQVTDDLTQAQRDVMLHTPRSLSLDDFWWEIEQIVSLQGYVTTRLDIAHLTTEGSAISILADALCVEWPSSIPRTISYLADYPLNTDILCLTGWEKLDQGHFLEWINFVKEWSGFRSNPVSVLPGQHKRVLPALCLLLRSCDHADVLPIASLQFSVRWWWGFSTGSETRILAQEAQFGTQPDLLDQWREHLLASLAAGDPELVVS